MRPLGMLDGVGHYLDIHGQHRAVGKLETQAIMALFGHRLPELCRKFPSRRRGQEGGFDQTAIAMAAWQAVSEKGLFDPQGAVRGRGAWCDDDGRLVYHLGDQLIIGGRECPPSEHQGIIYPAFPPIPHPAPAGSVTSDPAAELLTLLRSWRWRRPGLDPVVALGLVGLMPFGGALDWRPAFWFTGGAGTGKSSLQKLLELLSGGDKGLIQSSDPTARGIASLLGQSTLPVALDELEPGDAGSTKERDIIATARVASSGGRWLRGSSDQKGSTGQLRSTFLFSSILVPGVLKSQDLQRLIVLQLDKFEDRSRVPSMPPAKMRALGAAIRRLIIDRWAGWAERLDAWRMRLDAHDVFGRDADNWATVLAMAGMIQSAKMEAADEMDALCAQVAGVVHVAHGEAWTDADEVVLHLLSHRYDPFRRGQQYTIAQWLMVAAGAPGAPEPLLNDFSLDDHGRAQRRKQANALLAPLLLRVIDGDDGEPRLFVGNAKAQPLLEVFRDTQWAGGAWKQSMERIEGAVAAPNSRTLAGIPTRGVEVPLRSLPGLITFPQDRPAPPPPSQGSSVYEDFA